MPGLYCFICFATTPSALITELCIYSGFYSLSNHCVAKSYKCSVEKRDLGTQDLNGQTLQLPPIVLASYGTDPGKKTVLVYGHYDVQPVSRCHF